MASSIDDEHQGPRRSGLVPPHAHAGGYARVEQTEMVAACVEVRLPVGNRKRWVSRW
jgi:hypothetical protein